MSTAKFEQLIDLIINEDQERAEQLFHEIVVEKSREIYESLMDEEMSGDMPEQLMREISSEEEDNMSMGEAEDEEGMDDLSDLDDEEMPGEEMPGQEMPGDEMGGMDDMGSEEPATKDDIMNLEDKLDQILAQFEEEQGEEEEEEDFEEPAAPAASDEEGEEEPEEAPVMEAHELKQIGGKTYNTYGKMGDDGDKTAKSPVANRGQMGMAGNPVKFSGASETMPSSPKANTGYVKQGGDLISKPKNAIDGAGNLGSGKGESAPKPKSEDPGKSKSPVAESKKIVKKIVR